MSYDIFICRRRTTSSIKILILSQNSLYTNKAKVSNDSAHNGNFSVFYTKCNNFEVKYLTNWWQDRKIDCQATKRIVLRYKIGCYFLSLENKIKSLKKGPIYFLNHIFSFKSIYKQSNITCTCLHTPLEAQKWHIKTELVYANVEQELTRIKDHTELHAPSEGRDQHATFNREAGSPQVAVDVGFVIEWGQTGNRMACTCWKSNVRTVFMNFKAIIIQNVASNTNLIFAHLIFHLENK